MPLAGSTVAGAAGLQIMMLKPETPESELLVDWVEGGEKALSSCCASHPAPPCNIPTQASAPVLSASGFVDTSVYIKLQITTKAR